jgi:hypothetical protein
VSISATRTHHKLQNKNRNKKTEKEIRKKEEDERIN